MRGFIKQTSFPFPGLCNVINSHEQAEILTGSYFYLPICLTEQRMIGKAEGGGRYLRLLCRHLLFLGPESACFGKMIRDFFFNL